MIRCNDPGKVMNYTIPRKILEEMNYLITPTELNNKSLVNYTSIQYWEVKLCSIIVPLCPSRLQM